MSYILDALNESQRSREERSAPDLHTIHSVPDVEHSEEKAKNTRLLIAVVCFVVLAGAAGWWFAALQPVDPSADLVEDMTDVAAQPRSPQALQPQQVPEVPPAVEESHEELKDPLVMSAQSTVEVEQPVEEVAHGDETAVELPKPQVVVAERHQPAESKQPVADLVGSDKPVPLAALNVPSQIKVMEDETEIAADTNVAEPKEAAEEYIPHVRELPLEMQQQVSHIQFSVHLYSPTPERRMVKIDGRVRREGSEVSSGVTLTEITPGGAIFSYRDQKFRIPVR